jgi:hypothetical protein
LTVYEESNILVSALEFRVFTHLGIQARTEEYISRKTKLTFEGAMALLEAQCSMNVLIKIQPHDAALFSLTMLMFTVTERTYSFNETETLLRKIGFGILKRFNLDRGSSVIEAEKI